MKLRKHTLLTFDAFGTLIVPREPIARQYADAARSHGLSGFTEDDVARNFRTAFKEQSRQNPNYGKATGMGAAKWWANIIHTTFQKHAHPGDFPKDLVPDLLNRFSSSRGYMLYPDVLPFFQAVREARRLRTPHHPLSGTVIGVLSNSDDRIPLILSDLGLQVGALRYEVGPQGPQPVDSGGNVKDDIDFVALSYDIGHEKPHVKAFEAARELGEQIAGEVTHVVHVGDDLEKDVKAARAAGWHGIELGRNKPPGETSVCIRDLTELEAILRIATA